MRATRSGLTAAGGTWATGEDKNPDFASHVKTTSDVFAAQGSYMVTKDIMALFRYEYQDIDGVTTERYIPTVSFSPLEIQNTKVTLEYQHAETENVTSNIALLGIRVAF